MAEGKMTIEQPKVEKIVTDATPEKKREIPAGLVEHVLPSVEKPKEAAKSQPSGGEKGIIALSPAQAFQKQRADAIDNILAEGLNEVFLKMPPDRQAEFKKKGEETVAKINKLLNQTRVQISKIINLIRKWLRLIPGINLFFLEQEAKLKADKIIHLKDR